MKSTFKVLFYLKKGSEKKNGEVMIMARITIDGKLCQFSTKQSILPDSWNIAAGKAKGKDAGKINALLDDIKASLNNIYHEQQRRDNYVTAEKVKNEFLGHTENHETLLNLFQKHNDDVKQLVLSNMSGMSPHEIKALPPENVQAASALLMQQGLHAVHGKGLINFPKINFFSRPACFIQHFLDRADWRNGKFRRMLGI